MVMIDWISAVVPLANAGELHNGRVVSMDADGVIEWQAVRRLEVEGSYSTKLQVRGRHDDALEFSGNPSKYLQGHNVFGSGSVVPLMNRTLLAVAGGLPGVSPSAVNLADWESGAYSLTRVDVAGTILLDSDETVRKVLNLVGQYARTKYQSAIVRSGTVYIGKNSRRIALKLYSKGEEIASSKKGHGLCAKLVPDEREKLLNYSRGALRVELTLRGMELRERGLHRASHWSQAVAEQALRERMNAVELNDTVVLADDIVEGFPAKLVPVYDAWKAGRDLQKLYSRPTFYRHRKALLPFGIDIARVQPRVTVPANQYPLGKPLREILSMPFADVPAWAIGTNLLAS
jgi:II/X family phage/plasmid replication protein